MSLHRSPSGFLGVLMLDTRFPRVVGDVGHPASWRMPVRFAVVAGASSLRVVAGEDLDLLQPFVAAASALVAQGAAAITTSCGFLLRWQARLQAAVPVPVWTSSLLLLPELTAPGVVTVDAAALQAQGLATGTPAEGLAPGCSLQRTLLEDRAELDTAAAEMDVVAAALRLVRRHPEVQSLVLECTNMPPYAEAVRGATGLPVHHLISLVHGRWKTS